MKWSSPWPQNPGIQQSTLMAANLSYSPTSAYNVTIWYNQKKTIEVIASSYKTVQNSIIPGTTISSTILQASTWSGSSRLSMVRMLIKRSWDLSSSTLTLFSLSSVRMLGANVSRWSIPMVFQSNGLSISIGIMLQGLGLVTKWIQRAYGISTKKA